MLERRYGSSGTPAGTTRTTWGYDKNGRLLTETRDEGDDGVQNGGDYTDTYGFDLASNRVSKTHDAVGTANDVSTTSAYNDRDEQTASTTNGVTTASTYDANGNTLSDGSRTFTWDLRDRMKSVWTSVEPIVSEELWERCNRHHEQRRDKMFQSIRLGRRPVHLFAGLIFCGCGTKMYVRYNSPNKYVCQACRNKIPIEDLDAVFYEQLKGFFLSPTEVANHLGKADEHLQERENLLRALETEHSKLKQEVDRVYRLYSENQIDGDGFGHFYKPLQQRQTQLDEEIPRLQAEIDLLKINHMSADNVLSEAHDLYTRWLRLNKEEKRRVVESITERITVSADGIDITLCHLPSSEDMTKWQSKLIAGLPFGRIVLSVERVTGCKNIYQPECPVFPKTFGEHLRKHRIKSRLSYRQLDDRLGVTKRTFLTWETDRERPKGEQFKRILAWLGYEPTESQKISS